MMMMIKLDWSNCCLVLSLALSLNASMLEHNSNSNRNHKRIFDTSQTSKVIQEQVKMRMSLSLHARARLSVSVSPQNGKLLSSVITPCVTQTGTHLFSALSLEHSYNFQGQAWSAAVTTKTTAASNSRPKIHRSLLE